MSAKTFTLSGQEIAWSFYHKVAKLSGSHENAQLFFLRAVENKADNIIKWISKGIKRNSYCWNACARETTDPAYCRKWIDEHFHSARPGPSKVNAVLVGVLEEMLKEAKGE